LIQVKVNSSQIETFSRVGLGVTKRNRVRFGQVKLGREIGSETYQIKLSWPQRPKYDFECNYKFIYFYFVLYFLFKI